MSGRLELTISAKTLGTFRAHGDAARAEMARALDAYIEAQLEHGRAVLAEATPRGPEPYNDPAHVHAADVWYVTDRGPRTGTIANAAPQATFLFTGTRAHEIAARYARTLAFIGRGGALVFPVRVWHPGTRQNPALVGAMDATVHAMRDDFRALGMRLAATYARATREAGDRP